ncbi:MAG: TetR/AcrR family transcriptional regulator [Nocardioidaceae bacterium]|nr:TetR/AcrR family transcriptional regulator [Nocardioidaceae bacterium]
MTRPPRDALRREVLVVARRLFSTIGYRGTSLQMIADESQCSKAALLYHFKGKSAILAALVGELVDDIERQQGRLAALPADRRRAHAIAVGVAVVVKHREALAMLRGLDDLDELGDLAASGDAWAQEMRSFLVGPNPAPLDLALAHTFEHGLLGTCLVMPHLTDEELSEVLFQIAGRLFDVDPRTLSPAEL